MILAIVGLTGVAPTSAAAAATIAAGIAFVAQGAALVTSWPRVVDEVPGVRDSALEVGATINAELIGGTTAMALGVLALLDLAPGVLLPGALLVLAVVLIFTTSGEADLGSMGGAAGSSAGRAARNATLAASGAQMIIAIGVDALAIIALAEPSSSLLLTLVGLLIVGSASLLTGAAVGGRILLMRR